MNDGSLAIGDTPIFNRGRQPWMYINGFAVSVSDVLAALVSR